MKRILVTGGSGYIGLNLVKRLIDEEFDISVLVRQTTDTSVFNDIKSKMNIYEYNGTTESLCNIFKNANPDIVFHLAAFFSAQHKLEEVNNLISSNILFGTQILEAAKLSNVKYLINTGTHWQHYNDEKYNPVCLYAATKQAFETVAKYYLETSEIRMMTVKLVDTFGPFDKRPKVMSLFKRIAKSGEILDMSPGDQELGLVYIEDVINAYIYSMDIVKGMDKGEHKSVVVAPKKVYTLKQVAEIFQETSGLKLNIQWGKRQYRQREMMKVYKKEMNLLDNIKSLELNEGIKKMLDIEEDMEGKK